MYIKVVKDTRDIGFILVDGKEISYNTYSHSGLNAFTYMCGKYQGYGYILYNNAFYTKVVDNRRIITSFFWSIMNHY